MLNFLISKKIRDKKMFNSYSNELLDTIFTVSPIGGWS